MMASNVIRFPVERCRPATDRLNRGMGIPVSYLFPMVAKPADPLRKMRQTAREIANRYRGHRPFIANASGADAVYPYSFSVAPTAKQKGQIK